MARTYLNTEENLFDEHTEITEKMKNKFYFFKCTVCGKISSKCIYKRGGRLLYDFTCTQCNRKRTNIERFGCENPFASNEIKEKIKKRNLEIYGVENVNHLKDVRDKITATKKEKYGEHLECVVENQKKSFVKKYGVDNPQKVKDIQEKTKRTNLRKYGVPCTLEAESVKEKCRESMLKKYGVDSPLKNENLKRKQVKTNLERFGVENAFQNESIRNKYKITMISRYGVDSPLGIECVREAVKVGKIKSDRNKALEKCKTANVTLLEDYHGVFDEHGKYVMYNVKCNNCGNIFRYKLSVPPYCRICNPISIGQSDVYNYVKSIYSGNVEYDNRSVLGGKEIDIYLPDLRFGIEYDGSYWHNDKHTDYEKLNMAKEKGVNIIFIHDYEWYNDRMNPILKSIIRSKIYGADCRIYARECKIVELDKVVYARFLNENHLQGDCVASVLLGLVYKGELVQAMSFSCPRFSRESDWEMIRECSKLGLYVVGGKERLLKQFEKSYEPKSLLSYCDARFFSGESYERCGFVNNGLSKENYVYVTKDIQTVIPRYKAQKKNLPKLLGDKFDIQKTEKENMLNAGYLIMYDAGNLRFIKKYN